MDEWRIASEIAFRLGDDYDYATIDEVTDEIARLSPAHRGVDAELLRRARDGVVLPAAEHLHEVVLRTGGLSIMAEDGEGVSWDPIKAEGEAAVDQAERDEETAALIEHVAEAPHERMPALHVWDTPPEPHATPARDAYALRLVVGRTLYDAGRAATSSPAIAGLAPAPELIVSATDLHRLGVDAGTEVKATSARGSLRLVVRDSAEVPQGVARLAFGADGTGAAELLDVTEPVTDLRVETIA